MIDAPLETCPGCGAILPIVDSSTHTHIVASASCWALYGDVLAREYQQPDLMAVHRSTVDAYAAQHPGTEERRSIQSVWVHLAGLYLLTERGLSPAFARRVFPALTSEADRLAWLTPPVDMGPITVVDVASALSPEEHKSRVADWAVSVWNSWTDHHSVIREVTDRVMSAL